MIPKDSKRPQKSPKDSKRVKISPNDFKRFQKIQIPQEAPLLIATTLRKAIVFWKPPKNQRIRGTRVA